jgi:hypothetical protein
MWKWKVKEVLHAKRQLLWQWWRPLLQLGFQNTGFTSLLVIIVVILGVATVTAVVFGAVSTTLESLGTGTACTGGGT